MDPAPAPAPAQAAPAATRHRWWLVEPRRPEWLRDRPDAPYYALAAVCIGAFMGQLDASIVTVALPSLQRSFHASLGAVAWVGLSYLVVLVAGVAAVGRLSDMFGRKLLYAYGFVVFAAGSGLCAIAPDLLSLDLFRALQALGAAMLQANSVAIIYTALPDDRLGRGVGLQGAAQAVGLALGPAVGGALLVAGGWRLIFLVNVPVGVLGVVAALVLIPRSKGLQPRQQFDWVGLGLFLPTIAALMVGVSLGHDWGWSSPGILAALVTVVVSGAAFVAWQHRATAPLLDPLLFRAPQFSAGVAGASMSYTVLFGTMLTVPFLVERAHAMSAGAAGLVLATLPVAIGVTAPLAGHTVERYGSRWMAPVGHLVAAVGLVGLATRPDGDGVVAAWLVLVGVGLGIFTPANNVGVLLAAPHHHAGAASGVLNMARGVGTAAGLALASLLLAAGSVPGASRDAMNRGFTTATLVLAGVAVAASLLLVAAGCRASPGDRSAVRSAERAS